MLGYLDRLMKAGGQEHLDLGGLRGLRILDVGGGSYVPGRPSFGPDLVRSLAYLGAEVTIVDPEAKGEDFIDDQYQFGRVNVASMTASDFLKLVGGRSEDAKKPYDLVVSSAFFGAPSNIENAGLEKWIQLVSSLKLLADVQIHGIQLSDNLMLDKKLSDVDVGELISRDVGGVVYNCDVSRSSPDDPNLPSVDFLIIDNRNK